MPVEVRGLDIQVPLSEEDGTPSTNFESRWYELVLAIQELQTIVADQEARIDALENP